MFMNLFPSLTPKPILSYVGVYYKENGLKEAIDLLKEDIVDPKAPPFLVEKYGYLPQKEDSTVSAG